MENEELTAPAETEGLGSGQQDGGAGVSVEAENPAPESHGTAPLTGEQPDDGAADVDAKDAGESKSDDGENAVLGVPKDGYTIEGIKIPEGVQFLTPATDGLADVCKELGLSQKAYGRIVEHMAPVFMETNRAEIEKMRQGFTEKARKDPEIGGAKFQGTLKEASRAYMAYADPELRNIFQKTGLDCHPGMIRMFKRIQEAVGDDRIIKGETAGSKKDAAKAFFYNSAMND